MRDLLQLLMAPLLLIAQAVAPYPAATAPVADNVPIRAGALSLSTNSPAGLVLRTDKPDFDSQVLNPLRQAQAAKAAAEAEAARKAALAAQQAALAARRPRALTATGPLSWEQIQFLGNCESGMTPDRNSGNGYYGAFQFSLATWNAMATGYARADLAPLDVQIDAVQRLLSRSSIFTQFPGCARQMQAAGLL